jgi:hypothetical protein
LSRRQLLIRAGIEGLVIRAGVGGRELFVKVGVENYSSSASSLLAEAEGLIIRTGEKDYSSSSLSLFSLSSLSLSSLSLSISSLLAQTERLIIRVEVGEARAEAESYSRIW